MDISKSFLKQFLTSIVFIATFGFANQNQIEQLLKTVDKNKNLTGFLPLLEKQSQNSFRHTGISNSIAVHNSRDDFSSVLIDSSFNGYSFISDVTDPLSWAPDVGFLLTYRRYNGDDGNVTWGFIGALQSEDGEEWFIGQGLNDNYPDGSEAPNLPTYNGNPQGRYPSASIINSYSVIFWNEETNASFGGGNAGGYPLYTYDALDDPEEAYWANPSAINTGCYDPPCDPADLWLPQIQSVQEEEGAVPTIGMLFQQGEGGPDRYYWIGSNYFIDGYILWNDPMLLFDFSDNEIISEYAGRPRFHINDNGVGYFVFSGYGEGYDSEGSLQSHTFFILKTTNYGETWEPIGETFNNGSFGFISDDNLNQSMLDAGLLGGTVQDGIGNDVILDQAFMGYNYQVFTDEYNELHIITTALPKNSESDSLYVGSPGAGYYHLHNSDPSNPGNWTSTMIRDMSDSYKVQIHPSIPTWQYLYADIAVSFTGGTIWTVTSAIRELIPMGDNEYTYDDLDLFGSVSLDNGVSWGDLGNLTDTPSGGTNGVNVELHPHLAPVADIGECFLTFQMPASEDDEYDMVMNRIYFATIGLESLSSSGSVMINEIMQNPSAVSDDSGEWFEIVNNGNLPINLFEYSIKDAGTDMHTIDD
ncbi:MAG: lamin tail domain-containing protein, partial [Candidatus Marinimicrobia bacterium]|nr:lamin tail domain-containing protein [Candidatus Neomarinimicrobiota bacterium]